MIPLGLTFAASATDAAIQNKFFRSGMNNLITLNEETNDITKIVKCLKEATLLRKSVKMKENNKNIDFSVCY